MDERRFEELERKRFEGGLTQEEANELGRMMAERAGEPYSNAATREADEEAMREEEAMARADEETRVSDEGRSGPHEHTRETAAQEYRQKEGQDPATDRKAS